MIFEDKIPLGEDNLIYSLPKMPDEKDIEGYKLPSKKQKFVRHKFPTEAEFNKLSKESQLEILTRELTRRSEGHWFFNNGIPTYLSPSHYFYLYYWYMAALTPDGMPDYRWAQTKWFYFIDLCEKDPMCFGAIMLSQKRFSKTEAALAHLYNMATLIETDSLFGMQALNANEAKNNLFKGRILRSHRRIPNYLKPRSNDSAGKKEIVSELTFMGEKDGDSYKKGLDNKIDWRPTLVSAYQGKRPREIFVDESGSIEEMDLEEWLSTVKQQTQIGKRAFGKIFLPATIEAMTPRGAPVFQKTWYESDPNKRDANGRTLSWLYRYFNPQYEGREDFIDEYGNSLVDEAKQFRANELAVASPAQQKKIKRQYPETVEEAFDVVSGGFWEEDVKELININKRKLLENPPAIKRVFLSEGAGGNIDYSPTTSKHGIMVSEDPRPNAKYYAGFDGTGSDIETGLKEGSEVSVTIIKGASAGEGTQYCPVAFFKFRPNKMEDGYRIALFLCRWFGQFGNLKLGIERNAGQGAPMISYFISRGYRKLLMKKQKIPGITQGSTETDNLYGWYRNTEVMDVQRSLANAFTREHIQNNPFIELCDSLLNYGRSNEDLGDSYINAVYTMGDWNRGMRQVAKKPALRWKFMGIKLIGGKTEEVWEQVPM